MNEKIKIGFEEDFYEIANLQFERAKELLNFIDIEFKKIDRPIDKAKLLQIENLQAFIIDHYWSYAKELLPKGIAPIKALLMTDFDLKGVVTYVYELRALKDVFSIKGIDVISNIKKDNYTIYLSKDKEQEYNSINSIIENLSKLDKMHGWEWNFQKILGFERISIVDGQPTQNTYYFSN